MANSILNYTYEGQANFACPPFLDEGDITVQVNGTALPSDDWSINSLNQVVISATLATDDKIRITRRTDNAQRAVSYSNGSILKAETLDKDSKQAFYLAQEAIDAADRTDLAGSTFYTSNVNPPEEPKTGDMWFDEGASPNVLKIYNGEQWHEIAPIVDENHYTIDSSEFMGEVQENIHNNQPAYAYWKVPYMTPNSEVYLNGVKLQGRYDPVPPDTQTLFFAGDIDFYTTEVLLTSDEIGVKILIIVYGSFTSDDVLTIKTTEGGYATTVTESEANVVLLEGQTQVAKDLAENYADAAVDTTFDVDGTPTYSAKHYATKANEDKVTVDGLVNGFDQRVSDGETAVSTQEGLSVTAVQTQESSSISAVQGVEASASAAVQLIADSVDSVAEIQAAENAAVQTIAGTATKTANYADAPIDVPFFDEGVAHYSAKHYANEAKDAANVSADYLNGWLTLGNESTMTTGATDPELISDTTFSITAPDGVVVNGVPFPIMGGYIDLSDNSWTGSSNITVTENNNIQTLTFDTAFASADDYQVMVTYNGVSKSLTQIVKSAGSFTTEVTYASNPISVGELVVTIYKFN